MSLEANYSLAKKVKSDFPVGKTLPGSIQRVQLGESYDYTIPRTGEVIKLDYNYSYSPVESSNAEQAVFQTAG